MNLINCVSCNTQIAEDALFCYKCGSKVNCSSCGKALLKDAVFCAFCGVSTKLSEKISTEKNTLHYHKTNDEIVCDVSLNDSVAIVGIKDLLKSLGGTNNIEYQQIEAASSGDNLQKISSIDAEFVESNSKVLNENLTKSENGNSINVEEQKSDNTFPHIKDIEKNLECNEKDWILIYAFYASNFSAENFTRESVYESYKAKRKTGARLKNFSIYWNRLFKDYLSTVNDKELKFKPDNLAYVKGLILGTQQSVIKPSNNKKNKPFSKKTKESSTKTNSSASNTKSKAVNSNTTYSLIGAINLNPKGKLSFNDFYAKYKCKNISETMLTIIYYLEREIAEKNIDFNKIYTCLKKIPLPVPNIQASLQNIKSRKGWVNTSSFSDLKLTTSGENFFEHEMNKN